MKFTTVKSEPGHCIVRCELDARNIFTGESWCVKIARQKCAMNVLENYPLLKIEMRKVNKFIKVGCAFPIVIGTIVPHAEFGPNDHPEDALHFII